MQCEIVLSRFVTVGDLKLLNMYEYVVFLCASKFIGLHIIIKGKPHKVKKKMKDMAVQNLTTPVRTQKNVKLKKKSAHVSKVFLSRIGASVEIWMGAACSQGFIEGICICLVPFPSCLLCPEVAHLPDCFTCFAQWRRWSKADCAAEVPKQLIALESAVACSKRCKAKPHGVSVVISIFVHVWSGSFWLGLGHSEMQKR